MVAMIRIFQHIPVQIKPPTETFQCIVLLQDHQHLNYSTPPQRIEADISMVYLHQLTEKKIGLHPASTKATWSSITLSSYYIHWTIILLTTAKRISTGIIGSINK